MGAGDAPAPRARRQQVQRRPRRRRGRQPAVLRRGRPRDDGRAARRGRRRRVLHARERAGDRRRPLGRGHGRGLPRDVRRARSRSPPSTPSPSGRPRPTPSSSGAGSGGAPETARLVRTLCAACACPSCSTPTACGPSPATTRSSPSARATRRSCSRPHLGELRALVGDDRYDPADRIAAVRELAARWHAVVLLKGMPSVVGCPDGRVFVGPPGETALATAGSGDTLAGTIVGLLAQGAGRAPTRPCARSALGSEAARIAGGTPRRRRLRSRRGRSRPPSPTFTPRVFPPDVRRTLALVWTVGLFAATLTPGEYVPERCRSCRSTRSSTSRCSSGSPSSGSRCIRRAAAPSCSVGLAVGIAIEVLQTALPIYRSGDVGRRARGRRRARPRAGRPHVCCDRAQLAADAAS